MRFFHYLVILLGLALMWGCTARSIPDEQLDGIRSRAALDTSDLQPVAPAAPDSDVQTRTEVEDWGDLLLAMVREDASRADELLEQYLERWGREYRSGELDAVRQRLQAMQPEQSASAVDTTESSLVRLDTADGFFRMQSDSGEFASAHWQAQFDAQMPAIAVLLDFSEGSRNYSAEVLRGIMAGLDEAGTDDWRLYNTDDFDTRDWVRVSRLHQVLIGPLRPGEMQQLYRQAGDQLEVLISPVVADVPRDPRVFSTSLSLRDEVAAIRAQMQRDGVERFVIFKPDSDYAAQYANALLREIDTGEPRLFRERTWSRTNNDVSRVIREFRGRRIGQRDTDKFATYSTDFDAVFIPGDASDAALSIPQFPFYNFDMQRIRFYGISYWQSQRLHDAQPYVRGALLPAAYFAVPESPVERRFRAALEQATGSAAASSLSAQGYDAARLAQLIRSQGLDTVNQSCFPGITGSMYRTSNDFYHKIPPMIQVTKGGFRLHERRPAPVVIDTIETGFGSSSRPRRADDRIDPAPAR